MKYEVSQGQFVAFLNTLTASQQVTYQAAGWSGRNTIVFAGPIASTTTPDRAMLAASSDDLLAYMDWAGLRPMTGFEFEKACRGPSTFPNEYAWGTASVNATAYTLNH